MVIILLCKKSAMIYIYIYITDIKIDEERFLCSFLSFRHIKLLTLAKGNEKKKMLLSCLS